MKKMFTLLSGLFLTIAVMAADKRPVVTLRSMSNYKIVIDGRPFFSNYNQVNINNLNRGYHFVQVFEIRRDYFRQRERLVSTSSFFLRKNDVRILVTRFGDIRIRETENYGHFDRDEDDWFRDDRGNDRGRDDNRGRGDDRRDNDHRRY